MWMFGFAAVNASNWLRKMRPALVVPGARSSEVHSVSVIAPVSVIGVRVGSACVAVGAALVVGTAAAVSTRRGVGTAGVSDAGALPAHATLTLATISRMPTRTNAVRVCFSPLASRGIHL